MRYAEIEVLAAHEFGKILEFKSCRKSSRRWGSFSLSEYGTSYVSHELGFDRLRVPSFAPRL